ERVIGRGRERARRAVAGGERLEERGALRGGRGGGDRREVPRARPDREVGAFAEGQRVASFREIGEIHARRDASSGERARCVDVGGGWTGEERAPRERCARADPRRRVLGAHRHDRRIDEATLLQLGRERETLGDRRWGIIACEKDRQQYAAGRRVIDRRAREAGVRRRERE